MNYVASLSRGGTFAGSISTDGTRANFSFVTEHKWDAKEAQQRKEIMDEAKTLLKELREAKYRILAMQDCSEEEKSNARARLQAKEKKVHEFVQGKGKALAHKLTQLQFRIAYKGLFQYIVKKSWQISWR